MDYVIKNEHITLCVSSVGAEMQSIRDSRDREYLWQGDGDIWGQRAPVLFPYIGRMTEQTYCYQGQTYSMGLHGFAAHMEFKAVSHQEQEISLEIRDTPKTREQYPFSFVFQVSYRLEGKNIHITYQVKNLGESTMYFGLGGHPGFRVPLGEGLSFEDYELLFEEQAKPVVVGISDGGFVTGTEKPFLLGEKQNWKLNHEIFDRENVILGQPGHSIRLYSPKGGSALRVNFPQMSYLGIWQEGGKQAPFLCLEPWTSLPSRQDIIEDLEQQDNLERLEPGKQYQNEWDICLDIRTKLLNIFR